MTYPLALLLVIIAVAIIVALGVYAQRLRKQVQAREQALQDVVDQARVKTLENVSIIAQALLDEQIDVMEASLRIRTLIDIIEPDWFELEPMKVFVAITRRGGHLATHGARKELPKQERMKQDMERISLEGEYYDAVLDGARWLLEQKT